MTIIGTLLVHGILYDFKFVVPMGRHPRMYVTQFSLQLESTLNGNSMVKRSHYISN